MARLLLPEACPYPCTICDRREMALRLALARQPIPASGPLTATFAATLGEALLESGWRLHQPRGTINKHEPQSTGAAVLDMETQIVVDRLQNFFDSAVAGQPQPSLTYPIGLPTDQFGHVHLPWASAERPAERTASFTNPDTFLPIWQALVIEIGTGWASVSPGLSYGLVFLGPKNRLIFWPRFVNALLAAVPSAFGSVLDLLILLEVAWGVKLDLKSAYRSITVAHDDSLYLAANVDGVLIVFTRLPFGLACSPAYFTAALAATLRRLDPEALRVALATFVDDLGLAGGTPLATLVAVERLVHGLVHHGWWLSIAKAFLRPVARLYYIGFIADLPHLCARLEPGRLAQLLDSLAQHVAVPSDLYAAAAPTDQLEVDAALLTLTFNPYTVPMGPHAPLPALPTRSPASLTPDHDLLPATFASLRSIVGNLAWYQTIVPIVGHWRRALEGPIYSGQWSPHSVAAYRWFLTFGHHLASFICTRRRPPYCLTITTDAGGTGWGARLDLPDGSVLYFSGAFPSHIAALHSTAREMWAAVAAVAATLLRSLPIPAVRIISDNAPFMSAATHGTAHDLTNLPPLRVLGVLALRGLPVDFEWSSRRAGFLPQSDALTAAASLSWCLLPILASALYVLTGGWDIHLATDEAATLAPGYTTAGTTPSTERARMLVRIASSIPPGACCGWLSASTSYVPAPGTVAFAFPQWSDLPAILSTRDTTRFPLLLITPLHPCEWWGPALTAALTGADPPHIIPLPPTASYPPGLDVRAPGAPDPRQLQALWWPPSHLRPRPRPAWLMYGPYPQIHVTIPTRVPPTIPFQTSLMRGGRCPRDRPASRRRGHVGSAEPSVPERSIHHLLDQGLATASQPVASANTAPPPLPHTHHPPSAPSPLAHGDRSLYDLLRVPPSAPSPAHAAPAPTVAALPTGTPLPVSPPPVTTPVATLGAWIERLGGFATGRQGSIVPSGLPAAVLDDVATADGSVIRKGALGSDRPFRVPRYLLTHAAAVGALETPYSLGAVDAFITSYVVRRLLPHPPYGWQRITVPSSVADDCSSIATLSRKIGLTPFPNFCGPKTEAYLNSKGALDQREHSAAYPFLTSALLAVKPPLNHRDRRVWEFLWVMSLFCLRTGVVQHVTPEMFVPYMGGYILVWRAAFKTGDGDVDDATQKSLRFHFTASSHPDLHSILRGRPPGAPIFSDINPDDVTAFVRRSLPQVPASFDVRTYGARTGAEAEATVLVMPPTLNDVLFWWKREKAAMRTYYAPQNILHMFLFASSRLDVRSQPLGPGMHAAAFQGSALPDWNAPVASMDPLPPIDLVAMDAAWRAVPHSLIDARTQRSARRLGTSVLPPRTTSTRAPQPSIPAAQLAAPANRGRCVNCRRNLRVRDKATLCELCDIMVCTICHPFDTDYYCPSHRAAAPPPAPPATKVRRLCH